MLTDTRELFINKVINDFNGVFSTSALVDINKLKRFRDASAPSNESAENLRFAVERLWREIAVPAAALYSSRSYGIGEEPDYFAFVQRFDKLIKGLILVGANDPDRIIEGVNAITYGGNDCAEYVTDALERIDAQERNPQITLEKYNRMAYRARTDAQKSLGIHRKIAESVSNKFKLSRIPKMKKLQYLLILDEYITANFSNSSASSQRISERDDYKVCVSAMTTLKEALNADVKKDVRSISLSVLTPHAVNFKELRRRMRARLEDTEAIKYEIAEFRREMNRVEINKISRSGRDASIRANVAEIISKLEAKEK